MGIEVLIPDFDGSDDRLQIVMEARPDILNHNLETVKRLQKPVRKRARWDRSLYVLRRAKEMAVEIGYAVHTKSSLMVGLGETRDELTEAFEALRAVDVDILTVGQYLRPSEKHLPLERYYHPDEFAEMKAEALALGFKHVESAPLVRSSYHARDQVPGRGAPRPAPPPGDPRRGGPRRPAGRVASNPREFARRLHPMHVTAPISVASGRSVHTRTKRPRSASEASSCIPCTSRPLNSSPISVMCTACNGSMRRNFPGRIRVRRACHASRWLIALLDRGLLRGRWVTGCQCRGGSGDPDRVPRPRAARLHARIRIRHGRACAGRRGHLCRGGAVRLPERGRLPQHARVPTVGAGRLRAIERGARPHQPQRCGRRRDDRDVARRILRGRGRAILDGRAAGAPTRSRTASAIAGC